MKMLATISITNCDLNLDVALLPSIQISGSSHQSAPTRFWLTRLMK
ncbi:predicted protein [Botrytis cinerea T4]|uniref:Uncharacterized protein n=1 Tax=Botryotinia fuckeliana (strain T4) TaxID=999810 RepID=G2YNS8_BOTF4|nr:predicted protein [Botrytis cinerea T4]